MLKTGSSRSSSISERIPYMMRSTGKYSPFLSPSLESRDRPLSRLFPLVFGSPGTVTLPSALTDRLSCVRGDGGGNIVRESIDNGPDIEASPIPGVGILWLDWGGPMLLLLFLVIILKLGMASTVLCNPDIGLIGFDGKFGPKPRGLRLPSLNPGCPT